MAQGRAVELNPVAAVMWTPGRGSAPPVTCGLSHLADASSSSIKGLLTKSQPPFLGSFMTRVQIPFYFQTGLDVILKMYLPSQKAVK